MLAAHDGAASALDVNPHIRGCLVTGGTDKMVKIWNVNDKTNSSTAKKEVSLVTSRDLGVVSLEFLSLLGMNISFFFVDSELILYY